MEVVEGKFPSKTNKMDTENLPWYKLKPSTFEGARYRGLKKSERLLLRELFDLYWKEGGLPSNPQELSELLYEDYTPQEISIFLKSKASRWIIVKGKELYCSRLENIYGHIVKTREAKGNGEAEKPRKKRKFLIGEAEASEIVFALQMGNDTDGGTGRKLLHKAFPELEAGEIGQIAQRISEETFEGNYKTYLREVCMKITRKDSDSGNKTDIENKAG